MVFRLIRQVTEEIQARERFQLVDVHHVASQVLVPVRLVFKPEAQGLIASAVLHQQGAKEILGHYQAIGERCQDLVCLVYRASLAYVERVVTAGISGNPLAQLTLHVLPYARIEGVELRRHVGEEERLIIGLKGIKPVSGGTEVAMVVARPPERVCLPTISLRQVRVLRILVVIRLIAGGVGNAVGSVHLVARPAVGLLLPIPFQGVIDALLAVGHIGMMHQHYTRSSFHLGEFQTGHLFRHACRGHVLVEIGVCHAAIPVIITSASGKQQHQGKEGQDIETDIFHK